MKLLLTGGSGLVGHNLREHPQSDTIDIIAPSRKEMDLFDYGSVVSFIRRNAPDMIVHAAGTVGGIHANMSEPVRFLVENLDMGRNIVLAAREAGVRRLINLGSSCIYPHAAPNPLREESLLSAQLEPTNEGYALAKIAVLKLCEYISRENPQFQYKTLLPCNLYGRWDKFDAKHSHLIAAIIQKIDHACNHGETSVEIWGDGTARREFMYAGDLADCLMKGVERFDELPPLANVGIGHDYTINEYYQAVADVIGFKGEFVHDLSKPVGMKQKVVSVEKLSAWGWRAQTALRDGIALTYRFYSEAGQAK